jgi:unsaturated rhamnogalacturonyl hydrolase
LKLNPSKVQKLVVVFLIASFCCSGQKANDWIAVTVKRNYTIPKNAETAVIAIDWTELTKRFPKASRSSLQVKDQNFSRAVTSRLVDVNGDKKPDYLVFNYTFESNEPIFTFLIESTAEKPKAVVDEKVAIDTRLKISFLKSFPAFEKQKGVLNDVADKLVQSTLAFYPDVKDFPIYAPNRWNYEYSFFLYGCYLQGRKTGNPAFGSYAQKWLDSFITEDGQFKTGVYDMSEYKLDDVIPARLAILFHQQTGLAKYKSIADTIALQLKRQPKTSDGGYWHKQIYPNQMWLDGVFMGDVFSMQYANAYKQPQWYDEAVHQIKLIYKHTVDPATGLLYHGWDESINPVWAHPQRGTSPEFWGRAIGWYLIALIECLDYLPADHPGRKDIIKIFQDVSTAVKKYQDPKSKLWYQVVDKGNQPGNWIETSCSAMFAYAFAKGQRQGFLTTDYQAAAQQAYQALLNNYVYVDDQGNLHLDRTVKIGTLNPKTSKGDFQYYISTECRINDYKGLASLLFLSMELGR